VRINFRGYPTLRSDDTGKKVVALQCLLRWQRFYSGELDGVMSAETRDAVEDYRIDRGMPAGQVAGRRVWTSLHSQGDNRLIKYGAAGEQVRQLQRALNAASDERLVITGIFDAPTTSAVKHYQSRLDTAATGVVTRRLWTMLQSGKV
jgi:peptidoglycan hydrolase-like protein with peptidoglycan-binding domain